MNLDFHTIKSEILDFRNPQLKSKDRGIEYQTCFFQIISWLPDFRFPIFRISEMGNIVLYFNNVHLSDCRLFLFHIGKRRSDIVFDWIIVFRFAICLNFLFSICKYYDRSFMNLDIRTIIYDIFASRFLIPYISDIENGDVVLYFNNDHLSDCRLFLFHIGKLVSHMVFDWMTVS